MLYQERHVPRGGPRVGDREGGKHVPGTLPSARPDDILLPARSLRDEVLRRWEPYRSVGGKRVGFLREPGVV
jgi:hypothetical protein